MEEPIPQEDISNIAEFEPVSQDVLSIIPENLVRSNMVVPLAKKDGRLVVGVPNIKNVSKPDGLEIVAGCPIEFVSIPFPQVTKFIDQHYSKNDPEESPSILQSPVHDNLDFSLPFMQLLKKAVKEHASEILIDQAKDKLSLRFRIRGVLVNLNKTPEWNNQQISRITNEILTHGSKKQDGDLVYAEWRPVLPIDDKQFICHFVLTESSDMVLLTVRFSENAQTLYDPQSWGMDYKQARQLESFLGQHHGMVVMCGTEQAEVERIFYGCLRRVTTPEHRVMSVEEHMKTWVPGMEQFEADPDTDKFFDMLKMIQSHQPDVIALNPLHKTKAVEQALRGSLKNGLTFGLVYAPDTITALQNLLTMDVEKFLINSALKAIVSVRSIRLNCQDCVDVDADARVLAKEMGIAMAVRPTQYYKAKGCDKCHQTGFDKVAFLFEMLEIDDDLRFYLRRESDLGKLRSHLIRNGFQTFRQLGIKKANAGQTTLKEVIRISPV